MDPSNYALVGMFFQQTGWIGTGVHPREGVVAVLKTGILRSMFNGIVWPNQDDPLQSLTGRSADCYGEATLSDIVLDWGGGRLTFKKTYDTRYYEISYNYVLEDGVWKGYYEASATGSGETWCILTPVSDDLLLPHSALEWRGLPG